MELTRPAPTAIAAAALALATIAGCCGSSDSGGSAYGPRDSTGESPTATATTPKAPPGATARGCGRTAVAGTEGLRVTGVGCDVGRGVVAAWTGQPSCSPGNEASRVSCAVRDGYRCLGAVVERGVAVSCSRSGSSISFVVARHLE